MGPQASATLKEFLGGIRDENDQQLVHFNEHNTVTRVFF